MRNVCKRVRLEGTWISYLRLFVTASARVFASLSVISAQKRKHGRVFRGLTSGRRKASHIRQQWAHFLTGLSVGHSLQGEAPTGQPQPAGAASVAPQPWQPQRECPAAMAPQPGQPHPAGPAPAAPQTWQPAPSPPLWQHLAPGSAPGMHQPAPPPMYAAWGPQVVRNPGQPMMMAPPAPPVLPPMVMTEEALYGAPPEILYRYCYRMAQQFCRMCGVYATEDHLHSRCHMKRLPHWRYWILEAERREAAAAAAAGQPAWYYQAPPPMGAFQ